MPFMQGRAPIRRTLQYLEKGTLFMKDNVRIVNFHFNRDQTSSKGTEDFVFWHGNQLQYKNPDIQLSVLNDLSPSPYIQVYFDTGRKLTLDVDGQDKGTIFETVKKIFCKTEGTLQAEQLEKEAKTNPATFGYWCTRHCICEVPGQVPCPKFVILPQEMRGKYKHLYDDEIETE